MLYKLSRFLRVLAALTLVAARIPAICSATDCNTPETDTLVSLGPQTNRMREILDAVAAGDVTPAEAEAALQGYVTTDAGRFDAARTQRSGVPEAVLATGKTVEEVCTLSAASLETTDSAIVTRLDEQTADTVVDDIQGAHPTADVSYHERAQLLVAHAETFEPSSLEASVAVVTAGTAVAPPALEAALVIEEMGATVQRIDDVGVASIDRLLDQVGDLRDYDVLVVAAGREAALPTVVAGLVDVPVIGLPVSSGYGFGGDGNAALAGMLQSCTALSVVNVDAGFTAGAQAGLIARLLHRVRAGDA